MILWLARILLWVPLNIMHPTFIKGRKNRPKGKCILACNHYSNWDIMLYVLNTAQNMKIMSKKELFKNKFFGWIVSKMGAFPVDRQGQDLSAIKTSIKTLKDNKKLFIFPEGRRTSEEEHLVMADLKSGMAMIAIKTKSPIVPIWIEQRHRLFRPSVYHIGKPFELDEFYGTKLDEETLDNANQVVRAKMLELRESVLNKKKK